MSHWMKSSIPACTVKEPSRWYEQGLQSGMIPATMVGPNKYSTVADRRKRKINQFGLFGIRTENREPAK